jgi:hypothetical protein
MIKLEYYAEEEKSMNKKNRKWLLYLPFFAGLLWLLFLYHYDFPQGDDFAFTVSGGSLPRIWSFYKYYYQVAGSRMANLLAQLFLLSGMTVWKIVTPFVSVGLSLLLFYWVTGRMTPQQGSLRRDFALGSVCAFLPGLLPVACNLFADTFLWLDGSCNYLYPLFLALLGALPFWNALHGRSLPRAFIWLSPVCLVLSGLLHEQTAVGLFVFAVFSLILLRHNEKNPALLKVMALLSTAVVIFAFTCPGAYYRLHEVQNSVSGSFLYRVYRGLVVYISAFSNGFWPIASVQGLCALYLLYRRHTKGSAVLKIFLGFGVLLAPLSTILPTAALSENAPLDRKTMALFALWVLYFIAVFSVFLWDAHDDKSHRYLLALWLFMWGTQVIPAPLGSLGRPTMSLAVLTILLALCVMQLAERPAFTLAQASIAAVGLFTLLCMVFPMRANAAVYQNILRQVAAAKAGQTQTVVIDQRKMQKGYFYCNAFSKAYYQKEIRQYYHLPENVQLIFAGQ